MKSIDNFKHLELSKAESRKICGGHERTVVYKGEVKTFSSDNEALADAWQAAWVSLGAKPWRLMSF